MARPACRGNRGRTANRSEERRNREEQEERRNKEQGTDHVFDASPPNEVLIVVCPLLPPFDASPRSLPPKNVSLAE